MLKTKVSLKNQNIELIGGIILSFIAGFILADVKICGTVSFSNIAIAGAVNPMSALAVLVGSLMKYVVTTQIHKNVIIICSMVFIILSKLILDVEPNARITGIITAASTLISGLIIAFIIDEIFFKIVFYIVYAIMAGFTAAFISVVSESLKHRKIVDLKSAISCAYAIVYVILIASIMSFDIFELNIGRIIGASITLIAAQHYGYTGGVLCGALTTCGAFLSSYENGMPFVLLSIAGLLTGYLYKQNPSVISVFFVAINFIFFVIIGIFSNIFYYVFEIVLSTIIFYVISPLLSDKWIITKNDNVGINDIVSQQMAFLASSISSVRNDSQKIADYLTAINDKEIEVEETSEAICGHCHNRLFCWYNNYDSTRKGFRKLSLMGEPDIDKMPEELDECIFKDKITLEFSRRYREKVTAKLMNMRFSDSRRLLFEQIKITEEIIASASEKLDIRYSENISKIVAEKLLKHNFCTENVTAFYNSQNRLLIELYFDSEKAPNNCERICDIISDELKISLDYSEPVCSGKEARIRIFEVTPYFLDFYSASMCASNSEESGDSYASFTDGTGNNYVVLSDGMGSGKSASLESKMVVSMFKRLITSGADFSSAIKLINSIMLTKSADEAFATLDVIMVNLDSKRLTVIKSGASATLIRHRNQVIKISCPTFPIGIVEEADTYARDFEFDEGDIIVMFSDGISENEYHYIKELLLKNENVKDIVDEICRKFDNFCETKENDDVTVIGLKLLKN